MCRAPRSVGCNSITGGAFVPNGVWPSPTTAPICWRLHLRRDVPHSHHRLRRRQSPGVRLRHQSGRQQRKLADVWSLSRDAGALLHILCWRWQIRRVRYGQTRRCTCKPRPRTASNGQRRYPRDTVHHQRCGRCCLHHCRARPECRGTSGYRFASWSDAEDAHASSTPYLPAPAGA